MSEIQQTEDFDQSGPEAKIEVRRNVALAATVGGLAAILALAFAVRAFSGGTTTDWLALGVLLLVTAVHVAALVDSRAPLLVVDPHGVRLRHGGHWRGIAWPEVDCLEHLPRRAPLRDGHLLVVGYDEQQLIVPLTLATTVTGVEGASLSDALAALADGRADVVEVVPGLDEDVADTPETPSRSAQVPTLAEMFADEMVNPSKPALPSDPQRGGLDIGGQVVAGFAASAGAGSTTVPPTTDGPAADAGEGADHDMENTDEIAAVPVDETDESDPTAAPDQFEAVAPIRTTVLPSRVELDSTHAPRSYVSDVEAPDADNATVVLDDLALRPAAVLVIGPQLTRARESLHLTIDQLSERTRIRPHVIEAMEVDDFGPCGGDFYARGHLRTVARVLGIGADDLLVDYDEKYADAPVDPRRVFESELATGVGGSIRGTKGGRNWSVLIASVMAAVLVWSLARLLMGGPASVGDTPVLNQSNGIARQTQQHADAVRLTLTAAGGGAKVLVRDGNGDIVFDGPLAFGQTSEMEIVPPIRIQSSDGSVTTAIDGKPAKALGATGEEVAKTLVP